MRRSLAILTLCVLPSAAPADVPVIDNPRQPPRVRAVGYEEVWRAGADDTADYIFGVITDAAGDDHGNVYLLDNQQQQVCKFSAEGEYRGLVSRRGQGPGEIEQAYRLHYLGEGRLGIHQSFPARLVVVDTAGVPLPEIKLRVDTGQGEGDSFGLVHSLVIHLPFIAGQGTVMSFAGGGRREQSFVATFHPDGRERHRLDTWQSGYDFTKPIVVDELADYHPTNIWTMDHDGQLYVAVARDAYEIEVRSPDGVPLRRIRRDWQPHRRTAEQKQEAKNSYSFASDAELPPISYRIADTDPVFTGLNIRNDRLWVMRVDRSPQGATDAGGVVDVFDRDGHLIEELRFATPYDRDRDVARQLDDGRLLVIEAFREAMNAAHTNINRQRGEQSDDGKAMPQAEALEVVVYRPRSETP